MIPAINELRYAGRSMTNTITAYYNIASGSDKDQEIKRHLTEACGNCRRADHDAVDGIIFYIEKHLGELESFVGPSGIATFFPRYTEIIGKINQVSEDMTKSRDGEQDSMEKSYEEIKKDLLPDIINFYSCILESEGRITTDRMKRQKRERINLGLAIGGVVIGLGGFIIGIVQWLF